MANVIARVSHLRPDVRLSQAVSEFQASIPQEEQSKFRKWTLSLSTEPPEAWDVTKLTSEIDRHVGGKTRRCYGPRFMNVLQAVQQYASLGDIVLGGSQNLAACGVWAVVRLTLTMLSRGMTYLENLSVLFMEAGRHAPRYQDMALLYPRSRTLQDALCEYFIVVVRICQHAVKFVNKSTLSRISSAALDSTVHQFQTDIEKWAAVIREEVTWLNSQVLVDESKQNSAFRKMVTKFKDSNERHYQLEAKLRLLDACSTLDYQSTWKQARKRGLATWFTTAPEYQQWKQQESSSTLLCTGKLGSGKTTLMASMVDDLALTPGKANLGYFFCRYDIAESLTARAIFGSLTRQLLSQQTVELTQLQKDYASQIALDCDAMSEILQTLLPPSGRYYILVDGLDECPQSEIQTVVRLLQDLQQTLNILICISYREEARSHVENSSKGLVQPQTLKAPEMNPDIETYIDAELQERVQSDKLSIGDPLLVLAIREALQRGAQGMFLWVALLIDCICAEQTDEAILHVLHDLPHNLSEVFTRVLKSSATSNSRYLRQIVQIIMVARRPLTIYEFREALSVIPGDTNWEPARLINDIRATLGCCGSLIIIDEEELTVRFAHHSIKHFFVNFHETEPTSIQEANDEMGTIILTYLNYGVFDRQVSRTVVPIIPASETTSAVIKSVLGEPSGSAKRIISSILRSRKQITHDVGKTLAEIGFSSRYLSPEAFHFVNYAREYYHYHIQARLIENGPMEKLWRQFLSRDNLDFRLAPWLRHQFQQSRVKALNGYLIPSGVVDKLVSLQMVEKILSESGNMTHGPFSGPTAAERIYRLERRWFAAMVYSQRVECLPLLLCLGINDSHPPIMDAKYFVHRLHSFRQQLSRESPLLDLLERFDFPKFHDACKEFSASIITQGSHLDGLKEAIPLVTAGLGFGSTMISGHKASIPRAYHSYKDKCELLTETGDLCVVVKKRWPTVDTSLRPTTLKRQFRESLATFQLGDDVFEIWPLHLPHGNLTDLWAEIYAKQDDENVKSWSIRQMIGIAEALDHIHWRRLGFPGSHGDMRPERILWRVGRLGLQTSEGILQLELPHHDAVSSIHDTTKAQERDISMLCCIYLAVAACLVLEWKDIQALLIDLDKDLDGILARRWAFPMPKGLERWFGKLIEKSSRNLTLHRVVSFITMCFLTRELPQVTTLRQLMQKKPAVVDKSLLKEGGHLRVCTVKGNGGRVKSENLGRLLWRVEGASDNSVRLSGKKD